MTCTPNLINQWPARLLEGAANVFVSEPAAVELAVDLRVLHAKIDGLTPADDLFRCAREDRSVAERTTMIDRLSRAASGHRAP